MGKNTGIEWTDHSWPVVNGCRRVSPGCGGASGIGGCYAERLISTRLRHMPKYRGLAVFGQHGPRWTGESRLWLPDLDMPLRVRTPARFFVANMGDLFFEAVTNEEIAAVYGVMTACPQHTFQVLTKRPARARAWYSWLDNESVTRHCSHVARCILAAEAIGCAVPVTEKTRIASFNDVWPLPSVWLGVSVEDQRYADERIPLLLQTPAAKRFVSYEPALGPVSFRAIKDGSWYDREGADWYDALRGASYWNNGDHGVGGGPTIDQVIMGGESGPGSRPMLAQWVIDTRDECVSSRTPFFFKQWGGVKKKLAGRTLDGRMWDEFPS